LEWRRRQRNDERRAARDRASVGQAAEQTVGAVHLPRREERGLLGSRYYVANPIVPLTKIAAVLNGDMIGRNNPDTAALLGSQPPHRNSLELVQMAIDANKLTGKFVIDSSWDRPTHPEGWYFPQRSCALRGAERAVAVFLDEPAFRLSHAARRAEEHRLSEADADDAVDVHDWLDRRKCGEASGDRSRISSCDRLWRTRSDTDG
jgi:hypothetical protein